MPRLKAEVSESRKKLQELVALAYEGRAEWMHQIILRSGYLSPDRMTATAIAKIYSVTGKAVGLWAKKMGCPKNQDGTYNLQDVVVWRYEHQEKMLVQEYERITKISPSEEWQARTREEQARKLLRENDLAEGKLLDRVQIGTELAEVGRVFRREAERIEKKHGDEIGDAIRVMIDRAEKSWNKLMSKR